MRGKIYGECTIEENLKIKTRVIGGGLCVVWQGRPLVCSLGGRSI